MQKTLGLLVVSWGFDSPINLSPIKSAQNLKKSDIMVSMRNSDIRKCMYGKRMTGRSLDFKILIRDDHKLIANRRDGYFAMVDIVDKYVKSVGELTYKELTMLGYSSHEEYLSEPFNKGLTMESKKLWIVWKNFRPNWNHPIVAQINDEIECQWEQDFLDAMVDNY